MDFSIYFLVFIFSGLLTFSVQKIFIHFKKFDDFNHRSSHNTIATRTGGIGIFLTLFLTSLFYYFNSNEIFDFSLFVPLSIMFIVGVYDDFYNANFKMKFLLQIIVAKIIIDQGYVISNYHGLFGLYEVPWILAQISTVFVFLVIINAINFIDGVDGLAITEVIKTIILIEFFSSNLTFLSSLGFLVISCLIPLYYFNFKKQGKVFLGDAGSLLLGSIVAIYIFYVLGDSYQINTSYQVNKVLFSILVLIYPLLDLLRVFIIRIKNRTSPFEADQNHLHHRLLKLGVNHITTVLIVNGFALLILYVFI